MAESQTIARPYADAAFKLALEMKTFADWSDALARLAAIMRSDEAQGLIGNPRLSTASIGGVIGDAAGQLSKEQRNFVQILAENDRLAVLPEIAAQFEEQRNQHEQVLEAKVTSAYPLTEQQIADIVATLQQRYGCRVKAQADVDNDLIGGVSIRVGDEVIDASVRGKLAQLAATLKN
jgi:F-type H+-transporting ATPase subunit delta